MKMMQKWIWIPLTAAVLMSSACTDKKNTPAESTQASSPATSSTTTPAANTTTTATATDSQGNWQAKPAELSSANAADIKADLTLLNQSMQAPNTQALQLIEESKQAANDPAKLKQLMEKSNDIQKQIHQTIMGLNLKSSEVQSIRTQMIDNLMTTQKLYELSSVPSFNMHAPTEEVQQLSQRSMAIQQKIATELSTLTQKYMTSGS